MIGETYEYNGKVYDIVPERAACIGCAFRGDEKACFSQSACVEGKHIYVRRDAPAPDEHEALTFHELDATSKLSNPKDMVGSNKLPIHLWPATATALGCLGFLNGLLKYGRANFRAVGVRASIYQDAAKRHLDAWFEGEECDPDDGVPHLAAALACIAIIVDAQAAGKLHDDRNVQGGYRKLVAELTPHVARLKELHAGKSPKHYTITDTVE